MTEREQADILASIRKVQENIAVVIGVVFALTMCIYFFTYAMMVDKGYSGALWGMGISSVMMLLVLFRLKRVSRLLAKLWLGRRPGYSDAFIALSAEED